MNDLGKALGVMVASCAIVMTGAVIMRAGAGPLNPPDGQVRSSMLTLEDLDAAVQSARDAALALAPAAFGTHPSSIALVFPADPGGIAPIQGDDFVCGIANASRVLSVGIGQRTKGETTLGDVVCVKEMDSASPKLMEAACTGAMFPEAQIHVCRRASDGTETEYLVIRMTNVLVTSYQTGGSSGDVIPVDTISLNFAEVEWDYKPRGEKTTIMPGVCLPN